MKRFFILLAVAVTAVACDSADDSSAEIKSAPKRAGWDLFQLYGDVKEVTVWEYQADNDGQTPKAGDTNFKRIYTFNENGDLKCSKDYVRGKNLVSETKYEYNGMGYLTKAIYTNNYDGMLAYAEYIYDKDGNLTKERSAYEYYIDSEITHRYNEQGQKIESTTQTYNDWDEVETTKYRYNQDDELIELINYTGEEETSRTEFKYDDKGRCIEVTQTDSHSGNVIYQKLTTYDKYSNIAEETYTHTYLGASSTTSQIYEYEYDNHGNPTSLIKYMDENGEKVAIEIYKYEIQYR
ncbi:MAG: hypothetical protein Q4F45_05000 [Alistipes sp.]|nr:hypothetical protein [Alistipes sp.]